MTEFLADSLGVAAGESRQGILSPVGRDTPKKDLLTVPLLQKILLYLPYGSGGSTSGDAADVWSMFFTYSLGQALIRG